MMYNNLKGCVSLMKEIKKIDIHAHAVLHPDIVPKLQITGQRILSKDELFEKLNIAIRQFAKRQETWFRGMEAKGVEINWLPAVQDKNVRISAALSLVEKYFKQ